MIEPLAYIVAGLRPLAIPIDSCHPDPANARKGHAVDRIAGSLAQYGQRKAIVVNSSEGNKIEAGNGTWLAAKGLGWSHIAAVIVEDDPMTAVGYGIADNRLGHLSEWDAGTLAALLDSIDDDLPTGFEGDELDELLAELGAGLDAGNGGGQGDAEPQVDRAEELRQQWGTELGQLWQIGEHRLIVGDCTDRAVVERVMGGERAGLAWFDPPFGIDLKPQRQKTQAIQNDGNHEARELWAKFLPILKEHMSPDTSLFLCQDWSEFDWTLPLVRRYFTIKSKVVWNKNVWGIGYYTRPKHEDVLYCWNGEPKTPNDPVADVWDVARSNNPIHAAEKPAELSAIAIRAFSNFNEIVIDWFAGVGGSLVACQNLSRRCRAIEISPAYCAVILQRMSDAFAGIDIGQVT